MLGQKWKTETAKFVLYNNNQGGADLRQFGPPLAMRQVFFNRYKCTVDLNANDIVNGLDGVDTKDQNCMYLTPGQSPLTSWAKHVGHDSAFCLCPYPYCKDFPRALALHTNGCLASKANLSKLNNWLKDG